MGAIGMPTPSGGLFKPEEGRSLEEKAVEGKSPEKTTGNNSLSFR
jgi:hypothetical protein